MKKERGLDWAYPSSSIVQLNRELTFFNNVLVKLKKIVRSMLINRSGQIKLFWK